MKHPNLQFAFAAILLIAVGTSLRAAEPRTISDLLQQEISFTGKDASLNDVCQQLAKQMSAEHPKLKFEIKLAGQDLQAEGITRNARIRPFELEKQTLSDALTYIVKVANPVPLVMDLTSDQQKLVWVVAADPDDRTREFVLLTSRAAAEKKYVLKEPFVK
jgi:hypothetical protein